MQAILQKWPHLSQRLCMRLYSFVLVCWSIPLACFSNTHNLLQTDEAFFLSWQVPACPRQCHRLCTETLLGVKRHPLQPTWPPPRYGQTAEPCSELYAAACLQNSTPQSSAGPFSELCAAACLKNRTQQSWLQVLRVSPTSNRDMLLTNVCDGQGSCYSLMGWCIPCA